MKVKTSLVCALGRECILLKSPFLGVKLAAMYNICSAVRVCLIGTWYSYYGIPMLNHNYTRTYTGAVHQLLIIVG